MDAARQVGLSKGSHRQQQLVSSFSCWMQGAGKKMPRGVRPSSCSASLLIPPQKAGKEMGWEAGLQSSFLGSAVRGRLGEARPLAEMLL